MASGTSATRRRPSLVESALVIACLSLAACAAPRRPAASMHRAVTDTAGPTWGQPELTSLRLLRHVVAREAHRSQLGLERCEDRGRVVARAARPASYRTCAFLPLARTAGASRASGSMLTSFVEQSSPARSCRELIQALAATTRVLGEMAQSTLRNEGWATWADLRLASRSLRGMAQEARRLARAPTWPLACQSRQNPMPAPVA
jgi:hypothetical protein